MKKNYKTIGIIILMVIVGGFLLYSYISGGNKELRKNNNESIFVSAEEEQKNESIPLKNKEIVVEIKGEVRKPDVYRLEENSIVEDLIKLSGGITEQAELGKINRAEKLRNNQLIVIPNKNNLEEKSVSANSSGASENGIININTADVAELDKLPGIGPARAADIIKYREEKGGFNSIEDIKNVKGIGNSSYEKLKDMIKV